MTEAEILKHGWQELLAGTLFMLSLTYLIRTLTEIFHNFKKSNNDVSNNRQGNYGELKQIRETLEGLHATGLSQVSKLQDIVRSSEDFKRDLERIHNMASNLINTHADPNSVFSTVDVRKQLTELLKAINRLEVEMARRTK